MRIDYDRVSGALYIKIREGEYDHTEDFSEKADVYLDVDAEGNVLGLEALSFEDLAQAVEERGGKLEVPEGLGVVAEEVDSFPNLTPREREVLQLLVEGKTNREIAERLSISQGTVRLHLDHVMKTLGVRSRDEARSRLAARWSE